MNTTKVVIEKVNNASVEVIGKTYDSKSFSGDVNSRNKIIGQSFITTDDVDENMTVRGEGKDTLIRKVEKVEKVEVSIQLLNAESVDGSRSLATAILKDVWTAKGVENDLYEVFVMDGTNSEALSEIREIASAMACTEVGSRALGKWYPVANGKRIIIRMIRPITKTGQIVAARDCGDCCCCLEPF